MRSGGILEGISGYFLLNFALITVEPDRKIQNKCSLWFAKKVLCGNSDEIKDLGEKFQNLKSVGGEELLISPPLSKDESLNVRCAHEAFCKVASKFFLSVVYSLTLRESEGTEMVHVVTFESPSGLAVVKGVFSSRKKAAIYAEGLARELSAGNYKPCSPESGEGWHVELEGADGLVRVHHRNVV